MAREGLRYQTFSRRALLMAGVQGAALTALGGRLYYLAVVEGEKYRLRADRNRISLRLIAPERGLILDRYGRQLAKNRQDFRVFLIPEQAIDVDATLIKLGYIVHLNERRLRRVQRQIKRQRKFVPVTVAQRLDWKTFSRVNVSLPYLPGVVPESGLSRFYPAGGALAHIVGYLGSPREQDIGENPLYQLPGFKVGRQGLESAFEDDLRGFAGRRQVEVNSVGREVRELPPRQEASNGKNIQLTLDLALQKFAAEQMGEAAAASVVMDVRSGELLALSSTPSYDPNDFIGGMSQENWQSLINDPRKPLLNKCVSGQFPPGSTIKPFVALAALEQGVLTPETQFYCNGTHKLGNHTFHCWQRRGHGMQTMTSAIANSCDVYFYRLAERLDIDQIADMGRRFGLGTSYDIGVDGQKSGLMPDRAWKRDVLNEPWHGGETLNTAIGQGAVLATPLQLVVMMARLATGRLVRPKLVFNESELAGQDANFPTIGLNPLSLQTVQRGMEMVMEPGGTAHNYARRKSAQKLAGKTGTAQVRRITTEERAAGVFKNEDLPWNRRDHALFVGYAPADTPRMAVSVLVQHGGGGSAVAAPIGRKLMDKAAQLLDSPPKSVVEGDGMDNSSDSFSNPRILKGQV